jgi:hypothetical protein
MRGVFCQLKVCFIQLEDLSKRWTSHAVKPGITYRGVLVDGQRYEVHGSRRSADRPIGPVSLAAPVAFVAALTDLVLALTSGSGLRFP